MTKRKQQERFLFRVQPGRLEPSDGFTARRLREKGYKVGDVVQCHITKPRTPWYHKKAHLFGALIAANLDDFEGLDAHQVLKRIQIEAGIGCDEVALNFPGVGPCTYRVPRSMSFSSMDQGEFEEIYSGMCRYIAKRYWPGMTEEQITEMAELMEGAA